jgi:hypothetical protein
MKLRSLLFVLAAPHLLGGLAAIPLAVYLKGLGVALWVGYCVAWLWIWVGPLNCGVNLE